MVKYKRSAPYIALQKNIQGVPKVFERFPSPSEKSVLGYLEVPLRNIVGVL